MEIDIELKVAEALAEDVGKGWARLDPEDIKAFNGVLGDLIEIRGAKETVARITGTFPEFYGKKVIQVDGITRSNAQTNLGEVVRVKKIPRKTATTILISPLDLTHVLPEESELEQFAKVLQGVPVILGDKINIPFLGGKERLFNVEATSPSGGVIINQKTKFLLKKPDFSMEAPSPVSYEDIGGLGKELRLVREMVELPLRYAEAFERLGIEAPKGVLLYGPPGTGKTLIARAIASETKLHFIRVNGPEIIHKFYGESEARLREIFEEATRKAPSVIFIDEIDALVSVRGSGSHEGAPERVASQFFSELDNLSDHSQVIVLGATNREDLLDPALIRAGRLDYVLQFPIPDEKDRLEIFQVHTRERPLGDDTDLTKLAKSTEGMVGSQIAFICRSATMVAIAELIHTPEKRPSTHLFIGIKHFQEAIKMVQKKGESSAC